VVATVAFEQLVVELAFRGEDVLGAAVTGLLVWAVYTLLVSTMVSLDTESSFAATLTNHFGWLPLHFAIGGMVALALGSAWTELGLLGWTTFILPVLAIALAVRQGADKARPAIIEARPAPLNADELGCSRNAMPSPRSCAPRRSRTR